MFDIGAKVVCVDDNFPSGARLGAYMKHFPKQDEIYTVRDVIPAQGYKGEEKCAILLEEIKNPTEDPKGRGEFGFAPERFRELNEDIKALENQESCTYTS